MTDKPSGPELAAELDDLRARLAEAEEVLRAIRSGNVDGVLVTGERGEQVYTLRGADRIYRQLIETMSEGAATLSADGSILYCNVRLADMLGQPLDQVLGTALRNYLPPADQQAVDAVLAQARTEPSRREINLKTSEGRLVPVYLSASRLQSEGAATVFCLVLTDLTEHKSHEQIVAAERLARLILEQAAEAIVVCDEQGRVIRASQAAQRFCDGSPLLRPFAEVFPLRTDASDPFHLAPVLQGETVRNAGVTLDRQGQEFDLILNAGPLLSDQQILGCVVTLTDITERKRAEEEIESQSKFPSENPDPVLRIARDGTLLYINEAGLSLLPQWHLEVGCATPPILREAVFQSLDNGSTQELDLEQGERVYSFFVAPIVAARYANLYGREVTERKRAEEALRQSEGNFRILFEQAADSILLLEIAPEGIPVIRNANSATFRLLGYERDELIGQPVSFIEAAPHASNVVDERRRSVLSGVGTIFEVRHRCKDGTIRDFECSATEMQVGPKTFAISVERDVTERKRAVEALRESRERVTKAFRSIPDALVISCLEDGKIVEVNDSWHEVFGYSREEVIGKSSLALNLFADSADRQRVMALLREQGSVRDFELQVRQKSGALRTVTASVELLEIQGKQHLLTVVQDVTERIRLEAQLLQAQKMETVGRLAGGLAHDFNNLLTIINGVADLALTNLEEGAQVRSDLQQIREAGERAASLTRQLLAFSRKQIMKFEVLNLKTLVAGLQGMLERLIGERIALVVVPTKEVGSVMADLAQIEQVVMNLAVNARDAMLDGGTLTIETRDVELDEAYAANDPSVGRGPHVMLAVSDTGAGMDEATLARLFEPFFTTKDLGKGTGLGLATVYGIVKQCGGSISVHSELGKGTAVRIYLPRVETVVHKIQPAPTVPSVRGTETILLVEDEGAVRRLSKRILQMADYTVLEAGSGAEALLLLERHDGPVHLMLTDVVLPGISGRDLAERLADIRPRMKVLFTSGYADDAILRHGVLDQAFHFIGKPYTANGLTRKVREVLDS